MPGALLKFVVGFALMTAYVQFAPQVLQATGVLWALVLFLFFPISHFAVKLVGIDGLRGLGLGFTPAWFRQFGLGLLIGAGVWSLLIAANVGSGNLTFGALHELPDLGLNLFHALVVALLGSMTNEVLTRGLVFATFRDKLPIVWVVALSAVVFALDDFWNEGPDLLNFVFSLALGLAFALTVARTGALGVSGGVHTGLNLVYWSVYGIADGRLVDGVAQISQQRGAVDPHYLVIAAGLVVLIVCSLAVRKGPEARPASI